MNFGRPIGAGDAADFLLMVIGLWRASRRGDDNAGAGGAGVSWRRLFRSIRCTTGCRASGLVSSFRRWPILAADAFAATGKAGWLSLPPRRWRRCCCCSPMRRRSSALSLRKRSVGVTWAVTSAPWEMSWKRLIRARVAGAIVTTDYETTAWLRFNHSSVKVVQIHKEQRYSGPRRGQGLLKGLPALSGPGAAGPAPQPGIFRLLCQGSRTSPSPPRRSIGSTAGPAQVPCREMPWRS